MKSTKSSLAVILIVFAVTQGMAAELTPADTLRAYHLALAKKACTQAQSLMTAQSVAKIQFLIGGPFEVYCTDAFAGKVLKDVQVTDELKFAWGFVGVSFTLHFTDGSHKDDVVTLVRECGAWKVTHEF